MSILKDITTEKNGISSCPLRIGFITGFAAILLFTCLDIFMGAKFMDHAGDWIKGIADYLGLGGAAIAGKNYTESAQ